MYIFNHVLDYVFSRLPGQLGFGGSDALGSPESVTLALRDLYKSMDRTSEPMPPIIFLQVSTIVLYFFSFPLCYDN